MKTYRQKLCERIEKVDSRLCVGLDPRPDRIEGSIDAFLDRVIDESMPVAAAFKPNIAYFEALGIEGLRLLEGVRERIPDDVPVILDAKRGDIGETQRYYAKACFEVWGADAVTLNAYLGADTLEPFLDYADRGLYLLAVTSNPGSADLETRRLEDGRCVFELVQDMAAASEQIGLVVGLTNASPAVLDRIADLPLLVPGFGAQGGDIGRLADRARSAPIVVNVSRGVLFPDDASIGNAARSFSREINDAMKEASP